MRKLPGVELDCRRAKLARRLDGGSVRADKQAGSDPGGVQPSESIGQAGPIVRHIEATLCRDLFSALGDERHLMGANPFRDPHHFLGARHLQVEHGADGCS